MRLFLLRKFQIYSGAVQPGVSVPTKTDMISVDSRVLSSSNRDDASRRRASSEPCTADLTTDPCLRSAFGSVKLLSQTSAASDCVEITSTTDNCVSVNSSTTASSTVQREAVSAMQRPAALLLTDSCDVNRRATAASTVDDDSKSRNVLSAEGGSVWRRVKPHAGAADRSGTVTVNVASQQQAGGFKSTASCSQPAVLLNDGRSCHVTSSGAGDVCMAEECSSEQRGAGSARTGLGVERRGGVLDSHVDSVTETPRLIDDDEDCLLAPRETHVDDDDSDAASRNDSTGYDLSDNNAVVTTHQLRDDIPDSELIDYSDDGGESLTADSSTSTSIKDSVQLVHIFIALFDYDPATMSPNPDAVESELPFSEGQLIKVGYSCT